MIGSSDLAWNERFATSQLGGLPSARRATSHSMLRQAEAGELRVDQTCPLRWAEKDEVGSRVDRNHCDRDDHWCNRLSAHLSDRLSAHPDAYQVHWSSAEVQLSRRRLYAYLMGVADPFEAKKSDLACDHPSHPYLGASTNRPLVSNMDCSTLIDTFSCPYLHVHNHLYPVHDFASYPSHRNNPT